MMLVCNSSFDIVATTGFASCMKNWVGCATALLGNVFGVGKTVPTLVCSVSKKEVAPLLPNLRDSVKLSSSDF